MVCKLSTNDSHSSRILCCDHLGLHSISPTLPTLIPLLPFNYFEVHVTLWKASEHEHTIEHITDISNSKCTLLISTIIHIVNINNVRTLPIDPLWPHERITVRQVSIIFTFTSRWNPNNDKTPKSSKWLSEIIDIRNVVLISIIHYVLISTNISSLSRSDDFDFLSFPLKLLHITRDLFYM